MKELNRLNFIGKQCKQIQPQKIYKKEKTFFNVRKDRNIGIKN